MKDPKEQKETKKPLIKDPKKKILKEPQKKPLPQKKDGKTLND